MVELIRKDRKSLEAFMEVWFILGHNWGKAFSFHIPAKYYMHAVCMCGIVSGPLRSGIASI